ncbi:unnamed protein product [Nippostrongylus brasiliensis]|uniref:Sialin (inferred by orthology to a human protein) n=1 Tax=Nippostrongylus brasiliensis TaxID=27835 RepID=A0A0N4Y0F1_NIPBR|nr:unnamed protein product [Nippostrongylus brasiliensis]
MPKIAPSIRDEPEIFASKEKRAVFPSTRFLMAFILSLCFVALSVATSNLAQAMICMIHQRPKAPIAQPSDQHPATLVRLGLIGSEMDQISTAQPNSSSQLPPCSEETASSTDVVIEPCQRVQSFEWTSGQQGAIYAAQNVGSLFMLLIGWQADRLNGKWTIAAALVLLILSNSLIPSVASTSPWLVFVFRVIIGIGDALLFPSASSMITRWFPPKERPFAVGFVSGGRQIGALVILPLGGFFCQESTRFGWSAIFYVSAAIGAMVLILWLFLSADKPSKHFCVSPQEEQYIARKITEERLGKRTVRECPPWRKLARCVPLYVAVAALVCHEYPLVIMLQLLPKYFSDVLGLSYVVNGVISSLPSVVLFVSKTLSCSTSCCKLFNFVGSLGLAVCVGITPFLSSNGSPVAAIVVLCLANGFAGMHTPGVQTALVQIAPAYSGTVNGIAFAVAAIFSIANKMLSFYILSISSGDILHSLGICRCPAMGKDTKSPFETRKYIYN